MKVLLLPCQSPRVLYYTAHILATSIVGDLIFSFKYLQYIGCLEVNTSMKSLDFDTRSQIAKWVSIFFIFRKKERKKHSSSFVELIQLFYLSFASQGMHQHCLRNSRTQNGRQKAEGKNGPSFIVSLLLFLLCYFLTNAGCWLLLLDGPGHSSTSLCVGPGPGCVLILLIFLCSLLAF